MRIDKVSPLLYNESNGGGEMFPGLEKRMMHLRMESKVEENRKKPPLSSPDVVEISDFVFAPFQTLSEGSAAAMFMNTGRKSGEA